MKMANEKKGYFNYWEDWSKKKDLYALTQSINRQEERDAVKHMSSLFPVDGEKLDSWVRRTARDTLELTENARYHHIHGTSKTWACHTSSRYCFICVLCDFVDILRCQALSMSDKGGLWKLSLDDQGVTRYSVESL